MRVHVPSDVPGLNKEWAAALGSALWWTYNDGQEFVDQPRKESCGVFLRHPGQEPTIRFMPRTNISTLTGEFEINAVALLDDLQEWGDELVGLYHSHPGGRVLPSEADLSMARSIEGSAWGSGFKHWVYAFPTISNKGSLCSYNHLGPISQLSGVFVEL